MKLLNHRHVLAILLTGSLLAGMSSCRSVTQSSLPDDDPSANSAEVTAKASGINAYPQFNAVLDLPVAHAPFSGVSVNWKQRLDQPYLYLDHVGDYRLAGARIVDVFERLTDAEIPQAGPPFILFYDDPAETPTERLRARVAIPVANRIDPVPAGLAFDVLPSTTVVYGFIGGAYSEVPRSYPALFDYLDQMHWVLNGPIRETYLVSPVNVESYDDLITEVQIPATQAR